MARCFYCLGEHETSQCIKHAADRVVSEQRRSTKATEKAVESIGHQIAEQTRTIEEAGANLEAELSNIGEGIWQIHDFLIWAHWETMWRMEKQIELLTGIHDMIKNPRATQADELFKMAADSLKRRRLADAKRLLLDARDLNPGDYRIHITLGHVYVQMDDLAQAVECFRAAVDYARTPTYKRVALLSAARSLRCLGRIEEAITAAMEVSSVSPDYPSAHYELAGCVAEKLKE